MQYKKKDISQRLLDSGREEFLLCGFRGASLKNIAKNAGITVSNFYRYFDSKSTLLVTIVEPAYIQTLEVIDFLSSYENSVQNFSLEDASEFFIKTLLDLFESHGRDLLILYDKCEFTRFEDFIDRITQKVERVVFEKLFASKGESDRMFSGIIAHAFVQSVFGVFSSAENGEAMREMLSRLLIFYFADLTRRI